ncbi:MAG: two-component sensor histidine kinase [Cyanobacteria bacterium SID2]|nr:two-component sensor histidine kinase [Cyanobacteria bacterium SID2]MBP0005962.1 two-component sensor histidine kinase [Cyanobacteria bacterium SBC]
MNSKRNIPRFLGCDAFKFCTFKKLLSLKSICLYVLFFLILETLGFFLLWHDLKAKETALMSHYVEKLQHTYRVTTATYKLVSQTIYDEIVNRPEIVNLVRDANTATPEQQAILRDRLFTILSPTYENLKKYNLRQLHFHLPDGTSFLRMHHPKKFGDPLFDVRYSVKIANEKQVFVSGFEEGRIFNGFRYVFPLFTIEASGERQHVGSVETSIGFQAIRSEMSSLFPGCFEFMLQGDIVRSKVFKDEQSNYIESPIDPSFVIESNAIRGIAEPQSARCQVVDRVNEALRSIVVDDLKKGRPIAVPVQLDNHANYVATFVPVRNLQNRVVAYILSYEADWNLNEYRNTFFLMVVATTCLNSILVLFITYVNRSRELLAEKNTVLQAEVEARTIAEQQAQTKSEELRQTLEKLKVAQAKLIQTEKMTSLNQLVAGVAHEVNNPISFIYSNIEPAKDYVKTLFEALDFYKIQSRNGRSPNQLDFDDLEFVRQDFPRLLNSIYAGATRVDRIVQALRSFSRLDEAELKCVDVRDGLESSLALLKHRLKANDRRPEIRVVKTYGHLPLIECYPSLLNQTFMNILINAIESIDRETWKFDRVPTIHITTVRVKHDRIVVQIANNGPAIPPEIRERIFDPFFTTQPIGKGTGLGLSTAYFIITEAHGGQLVCRSQPGEETVFAIELPVRHETLS